ncbi:hypothetical protein BZA77DRAFT_294720 [Pyronema omphalodes]|nr:hypothetical protein BZA77DRAFT_294720 [Pyronema omphalodes]
MPENTLSSARAAPDSSISTQQATQAYPSNRQYPPQGYEESSHTHTTPTRKPLPENEHPPSPWRSQDQSQRFGDRSDSKLNSSSPLHNSSHRPAPPLAVQQQLQRNQHDHQVSSHSTPQDQLERLAAEASSVVGGITGTTPSLRSESPLRYESTSSVHSSAPSGGSHNHSYGSSRDRVHQLQSFPERVDSAATSTIPTAMASSSVPQAVPSTPRVIARTASIDSSASAQSGAGHAHSASTSSNNAFSQITGSSPADIQALIQAAGSADELILVLLKEKQSITAQNSQLWRLVDKQRAMILGLNKDLERAMKEKDKYRKKLKEQMGIPPIPGNPAVDEATAGGPSRTLSESPAPSLDGMHDHSDSGRGGIKRTDSLASSIDRGREGYTSSALDVTIAPYSTPSPSHSQLHISSTPQRIPSPVKHVVQPTDPVTTDRKGSVATLDEGSESAFREKREDALPDVLHDDEDDDLHSTPISPKTQTPVSRSTEGEPQVQQTEPMTQAKKLGISTNVPPAVGLGKSPFRKGPPARLELPQSPSQGQPQNESTEEQETASRRNSNDSWQQTPDDKKSAMAHRFMNNGPLTAPPTRQPPAPYLQNMPLTPGPSRIEKDRSLSPEGEAARLRQQFIRAPMPSPGLPSSPRPSDRPAGSPLPRGSRNFSLDSGTPQPMFQPMMTIPGTPRASLPLPSPRLFHGHERTGSDGSKFGPIDILIQPAAIATVDCRVVSSRMKPSRASMMPGKQKANEDSVFTLGVFSRTDGQEILRVEKDVNALGVLDNRLRKLVIYAVKVPDRQLFTGYAPARMDARRAATDEFLAGILQAVLTSEPAALILCEFFSTDVVEHYPNSPFAVETIKESSASTSSDKSPFPVVVKEGYLTKRGKNFGGWKERYFVLEAPVLKYFDSPGGALLGQIKLHNAQIGRQSSKSKDDTTADEDNQYRHAFLVLEPKRKDSATLVRHVLCAENDKERDDWVSVLLEYVTTDKDEEGKKKATKDNGGAKNAKEDGKNGDDVSLRSMSYDEVSQGPAPARGPTPEELSRSQITPSPSSLVSQTPSTQFANASPVPDRGPQTGKQISAPSNGTVISDLAAWGAMKLGGGGAPAPHDDAAAAKAAKAAKKRSIWGFRQRSSSDLDDQRAASFQQALERFPLSKPVFGISLEEAVSLTKPPGQDAALPAVVYRCIEFLDAKNASEEEGIFRLSGSNTLIRSLKEKFNTEADFNILANDDYYDVHAIAGLLKLYLRELPTSILTSERRDDFVRVTEMNDKSEKITALNNLVHSLPAENFALLKALSGHLLRIVDNAAINKMTIRNVGIVFSPTLNIPAQVFSMFLHEYRYIFFRDGEAPPPEPPRIEAPPGSPKPLMSPRQATFDGPSMIMEPPRTPMLPAHPAAIQPPGARPQIISYEPRYDGPVITSPTQISGPRFDIDHSAAAAAAAQSSSGSGLMVPGQDAKSQKTKRRESSMMFMMGGLKKGGFAPSKSNAMVEEDLYG